MLTQKREINKLFILCWFVYFITYIGRLSYTSAMTEMTVNGVLSKSQAGSISMIFFFCYGIGQLINGFLGDRVQPLRMIVTGLSISAVCNLLMGISSNYIIMSAIWGISGYSQAMVWPPIIKLFSNELDENARMSALVNIATTMAAGTLFSYLLSALILSVSGWRMVFIIPSVLIALTTLVCGIGLKGVLKNSQTAADKITPAKKPAPKGSTCKALLMGLVPLVVLPAMIHGMIKDGVSSWVPTYISERFGLMPALSILLTTLLPVVNMLGAYAAGFVNRRIKDECKSCAVFFALSALLLVALNFSSGLGAAFSAVLLALVTSSMIAVNTLIVSFIPMRYSKAGLCATVSGFLNSMSYIGAALSAFTLGIMSAKLGWAYTISAFALLCAAGAALSLMPNIVLKNKQSG